jgi:multiple sugar transport system substrate-binding protein
MNSTNQGRLAWVPNHAVLLLLCLAALLVVAGCAPAAAPAAPTSAPTNAPAPTSAPAPTTAPAPTSASSGEPVSIKWWSQWASEPSKKQFVETVAKDYMAAHPNVKIEVTWFDQAPVGDAFKAAMTAGGKDAPDIVSDIGIANAVKAGWLLNIDDAVPWDNYVEGARQDGIFPGTDGVYKYNIGFQALMLFYNPAIFDKLGIKVPDNYQFTQDEFVDVVKKCHDGGYAGVADSVADRNYPAMFPIWAAMTQLVGRTEQAKYDNGMTSWDTPEMREVLTWLDQLRQAGMWPSTFATMGINEFHVYFHTQQKACMLYVPSWYSSRAFKAVADGGQSPDFHFKMLRYPLMKGAKFNDTLWAAFESGYMVPSSTQHPEVVKDILAFMAQPKYGALWTALTNIPSAVKYDPLKDWPQGVGGGDTWKWYFDEINTVYAGFKQGVGPGATCDKWVEARTANINEGLPQGLVTVDDAIKNVDAALCPPQ